MLIGQKKIVVLSQQILRYIKNLEVELNITDKTTAKLHDHAKFWDVKDGKSVMDDLRRAPKQTPKSSLQS